MAYTAPTIKDRVAAGDNKYTMQTLSDGRVLLTPSPDEVEEAGTEINKVLLQPLFDLAASHDVTIEEMLTKLGILAPYEDYWWRTRQVSAGYTLNLVPVSQISAAYRYESISYTDGSSEQFYSITLNEKTWDSDGSYSDNGSQTIKYATSITVDTSGKISLVNPTTITVNADTVKSYESTLRGKYVSGIAQNEDLVYKLGQNAYMSQWNATPMSYGSYTRYKTRWGYRASQATALPAEVAQASYSAATSDYSYLHNSASDFYPHSGTSNGVEYQYLGRIFDFSPPLAPNTIKTISVTSASWSNKTYNIQIPCKRYLLWTMDSGNVGFWGLVDNAKLYGMVKATMYAGDTYATAGNIVVTPQSTGLKLTYSVAIAPTATIAYLPLS